MIILRYGNTNTFFIPGSRGGLLVDTDYAGTLRAFCRALKENGLKISDIGCVLATHYHPDHMGLIGELTGRGVGLLLIDTQIDSVHSSDYIFARDGIPFAKIDEGKALVIGCEESRDFLAGMGIDGEIFSTPSHSPDSVSLILDSGECIAGDLEPFEYIAAYGGNAALESDWERIKSSGAKKVYYSHHGAQDI
ncbi:MAG: MBL fold metallo-hydrolase [Firmicutes bacterium]|nr:MBL fold metallo-hydrolase [Bacillota bacterium]